MAIETLSSGTINPALFGAISALIGVVAGGVLTAWQQRAQRRHDAAENTKGRIIQLRREVYVVAIENHTRAIASLERRPMISERDFKETQAKFFASLFKIQMVGSNHSIVAANVLARLFHQLAIERESDAMEVRSINAIYEAAPGRSVAANERLDSIERELLSLQPQEIGSVPDLKLREQLIPGKGGRRHGGGTSGRLPYPR